MSARERRSVAMSVLAPTAGERRGDGPARSSACTSGSITVDHKRLGIMYVAAGLVFFVIAGLEASLMRLQLAWSGLQIVPPGDLQPALHHARHDHGVPGRHPDRVRLRQLPRAAHDRRARPRLSAAQRLRVLGLPLRRAAAPLQLHRRRRALRRGLGPRRRLVRLRAAHEPRLHAGQCHRLLEPRHPRHRHRHHRDRGSTW